MMKLSIIVPIYGVEQYLRKCVDSLLAQDLPSSEYEIILVDDGSPDGCPAICDQYAKKSQESRAKSQELPYIRVIHRKNGGLSAARNSGIEVAKGEYLMFVDSDDYIEPNVLGGLMEQVERDNLDVLRFDYQNVRLTSEGMNELTNETIARDEARKERYEVFEPYKTPRYIDKCTEIVDGETYLNTRMGYACYAVMFIIRRDLLISTSYTLHSTGTNDCLFTEGIHFEDVEWLPRMMLRAKRVNSTPTTVYNYLVRQGSITKTEGDREKILKNLEDKMTIIEEYSSLVVQYPSCQWLVNLRSNMVAGVLMTTAQTFYSDRKTYIDRLIAIDVFPLMIANQGRTYVRRARIINMLGPRMYCWLMHLRSKI